MQSFTGCFQKVILRACLLTLLITAVAVPFAHADQDIKRVFILNSFNREYIWTDKVIQGIDEVFVNSDLNIETSSAFMDLKRVPYTQKYIDQLHTFYKERYRNTHFDAILASDNDAFEFLLKYRDELFPEVPVVFSAINDFDPAVLAGRRDFTGYPENTDYTSTIQLALKLRPKTETIVVVTDNTTTGRAHSSAVHKIEPSFNGRVQFEYLSVGDYTFAEVGDRLQSLKDDTVVLLLHHFMDKTGATQSVPQGTPLLTSLCPVPCFVVADIRVGLGALGGNVVSGYHYGQASARMVLDILHGKDIRDIPVGQGPNQNMFDIKVLQRFDIAESALPEESILLNRPASILDQYRNEIIGLAITFIAFISILIIMGIEIQRRRNLNKKLSNNIIERKKIEEELRKSETKFKALFEQAGDYILILAPQPDGPPIIVDANQAALKKHGFLREEFVGRPISDLDDDTNKKLAIERTRRIMAGEHLVFETIHFRKDGSTFPVEASVVLLKTGENESLLISIERDITERKMAVEELKVQKEILNKSQEIAHLGSWHFDIKKNVLTWSDEQYRIFGIKPQDFGATYEAFLDAIHPDDKAMVDKTYTHAIENNLPYECIHRIIRDSGEVRVVHEKSEDIVDENGKAIHSFGFTQDITEQKRRDQEKKELESRLVQAQKMEAIGVLAGGIAHDFNNILGVILGYTDMAIQDAPPGSLFAQDLDKVLTSTHRAKDLVKQILAFSRQSDINRIPLKMQPLIKESLKMLRSSIPTTISITEDINPQCGIVLADPTQIHQVLMNLCTNAFHSMEETGGEFSISLQATSIIADSQHDQLRLAPGEYVKLSVADTGHGIDPDIINRIFDPFFTTKQTGKGTGMGLAIIHGIIADYGGAITVESQLGKGSTFHLYFPVVKEEEALPAIKKSVDIQGGKERILFIDDEELLAEMGKDMLERLGYHVTVRCSSLEALETFQNSPGEFDLVITDQTMHNMTGADLAKRMLQIRPDIPIILCTGYSNLIDENSSKALGIKEFALKPLSKRVIGELIRKVLDGKGH